MMSNIQDYRRRPSAVSCCQQERKRSAKASKQAISHSIEHPSSQTKLIRSILALSPSSA